MQRILHLGISMFLLIGVFANAQDIVWTGNASNNDFFDEGNWKNSVTDIVPVSGSLDPGVPINLALKINNVTTTITAVGEINLGIGSLGIDKANLTAQSFSGAGGSVVINEGAYVELTDTTPFKSTTPKVQINFTSGLAWIKTTNYSSRLVSITNLSQIKVNGNNSVYKTNLRLDNYYLKGCVIRSNESSTSPLTVYDESNLQGTSGLIPVNTIHSADAIPGAMNNKIQSFILKKGFMVTFAVENDGTGKSKNYIASEQDLVINELPKILLNSISFIRVLPWNWVTKKGRTDTNVDLNTSWRYKWNNNEVSTVNWEYTPMSWGHTGADDPTDIDLYVGKYNSTHVMSFNEPDDCGGQSGQYPSGPDELKLCNTDIAVGYHKNLMKTGMRIVSPGCREEGSKAGQWLQEFYDKATAQDIRIDVIAVHWYDWGGNPTGTPNADANQIFTRFKAYITSVHNLFGLPIWITEFNANPGRTTAVNNAFMALALPWLEQQVFVERYNWYPFNPTINFYATDGTTLTAVGTTYKNHASNASIAEATVDANNNLNLDDYPNVALNKTATASSTYFTYGASNTVDGDTTTATSQWIKNFGVSGDSFYSPLPAWLEVDLQGSFTIDSFRIIEATKALKNFRFEVWDTTLNSGAGGWATALTVTNNPATPLTTYKTFTPVTTTKVRLYITGHNSLDYLRVFELEVYGLAATNLSTQQFEKQQPFSIYPNPVTNGVVNISGEQEVGSVEVYNLLGAKMDTRFENDQLQVSNLTPGVYFLRINNKYSFKFIKK